MEEACIENNSDNKVFAEGFNFFKVFWIFIIGCFLGDVYEVLLNFVKFGDWVVRRGVVYGPLNPVYGLGAALFYILLYKEKNDMKIFLKGALIGGIFEYVCSFVQEHVFGTISWNYSDYSLNFNGRTSIWHMMFWGFIAVVFIKLMIPGIEKLIEMLPIKFGNFFTWCVVAFMIFDISISIIAARRQYLRHEGVMPRNAFERKIDEVYTDERLREIFQNSMEVKNLE